MSRRRRCANKRLDDAAGLSDIRDTARGLRRAWRRLSCTALYRQPFSLYRAIDQITSAQAIQRCPLHPTWTCPNN
jgi:hypothetical protein